MNTTLISVHTQRGATAGPIFPALDAETRSHVDTACAAYWMNRRPQTLRAWACLENGPIRPIRMHGRLAWCVSDIRQVMGDRSGK
ncbi:hypothetical protein [Janthinobacterium sp. CG3]|uniref:hypothetical protein n=1 Tax=Janthinobacterium sp. CG3 TaxID=1075768 RepID=UPI0009DA74F4|nr:hypothetical protein [Janthinobacterium sp. CG3]